MANLGYQGWRSAENARLPAMWPGFYSGPVPYLAEAEFGFGSGLAVRVFLRFFLRFSPVFLSTQKSTF